MALSRQMVLTAYRDISVLVVPEGGSKFQNKMNMIADGRLLLYDYHQGRDFRDVYPKF